jgi:predicted MFS family arabinose efflux permease
VPLARSARVAPLVMVRQQVLTCRSLCDIALDPAAGLIIGALLVQWASWRWVFWTIACTALPIAGVGVIVIPSSLRLETNKKLNAREELRNLDIVGVSILTGISLPS